MKLILVTCLFVALAASLSIPLENFQLDLENEWAAFKEKFARTYNDFKDEANRKGIFADKLKEIKLHNYKYSLGLTTFTLGVNSLSDKTVEEIAILNGYKFDPKQKLTGEMHKESNVAAPASVDWRKSGYVTPVKNQGSCGSCWAFSSTGALEAQMFKKSGKLVPLSEQNLVDCSRPHGNQGCSGGWMHYAFNYIRTNGGMNSGSFYPYEGREYTCRYNKNYIAATVYTHINIQQYNEKQLMEAVANVGPVSVAIDASLSTFNNYKSGVMYDSRCSQTNLSHAVLVVGYGTENGQDFWLVKNSWGTGWGDQGYIKMARNRNNHCGIASAAVYPQV